jgi:hypothetical protein
MTTTLPPHLIGPDDILARCRTVGPANGAHFTREELHALLECATTEVIPIGDGLQMIIDADRKCSGALNRVATALARHVLPPSDCIVGPAIVCETAALPLCVTTVEKKGR